MIGLNKKESWASRADFHYAVMSMCAPSLFCASRFLGFGLRGANFLR